MGDRRWPGIALIVVIACSGKAAGPAPEVAPPGCHDADGCAAACDHGNPHACERAAWIYRGGHGVDADEARASKLDDTAFRLWRRACDEGHPTGCVRRAERILNEQGYDTSMMSSAQLFAVDEARGFAPRAAKLADAACSRGDAARCTELAWVVKDEARRNDLLARACHGGQEVACWASGAVPPEADLRARCTGGDDDACMVLAQALDRDLALAVLAEACARNVEPACREHDRRADEISP